MGDEQVERLRSDFADAEVLYDEKCDEVERVREEHLVHIRSQQIRAEVVEKLRDEYLEQRDEARANADELLRLLIAHHVSVPYHLEGRVMGYCRDGNNGRWL